MPAPENHPEALSERPAAGQRPACFEAVDSHLQRVRQRIADVLSEPDEQIRESLDFLLASPGKLIRPGLVLLSGACVGMIQDEHIDLAAMVELIHRASLLHDDVIDGAALRRQQQTANARWGNTVAVLLGDYLLSRAFYLGLSVEVEEAGEIISHTARDICRGELQQNFRKGHWDISLEDYYRMIEAKTASLFRSSCGLGAAASRAVPEENAALAEFGRNLGMAFQISDDLLDVIGADAQAGKTLGTDFEQGKLTLPVIHWLRQDSQAMAFRISRLQEGCDRGGLVEELTNSGSIDFSFVQIDAYIGRAKEQLHHIKDNPAVRSLGLLADYVAQRLRH